MELSQGEIIQKPKIQELSSLLMTHLLSVMHALFMTHCLNVMYAPVKFHEYIPYGLGVMARTRSGTYGRTDGRTDGQTDGQTDVRNGQG